MSAPNWEAQAARHEATRLRKERDALGAALQLMLDTFGDADDRSVIDAASAALAYWKAVQPA